jgi:hypothetical protein
VQAADALVERQGQRFDLPVGLDAPILPGRDGTGALLEDLQIVEAPQQILHALQPPEDAEGSERAQLARQLHRVTQLFGCDADRVDVLGHVHGARPIHGDVQPIRAAGEAGREHQAPDLGDRLDQERRHHHVHPLDEVLGVELLERPEHVGAAARAFPFEPRTHQAEGGSQASLVSGEFRDELQCNVQLAHASERPRDAPHPAGEPLGADHRHRAAQHGQHFAQPTGGHASVVHAVDVTRDGRRQVRPQGGEPARERPPEAPARRRRDRQRHREHKGARAGRDLLYSQTAQVSKPPVFTGKIRPSASVALYSV